MLRFIAQIILPVALVVATIFLFLTTASANLSALSQATEHLRAGRYSDALRIFQQADGADRIAGVIGASRTWIMTGRYAAAEAICRQALQEQPGELPIISQLAEILASTGRSDEALGILEPLANRASAAPGSLVQYGRLLQMRGRRDEAASFFERAIALYEAGQVFASPGLAVIGTAYRALGRFHEANRLFREALRADPQNIEVEVLWGDLFREKYNDAEARKSYTTVLAQNPKHAAALVGLARTMHGVAAQELLEDALKINASSEPALAALAETAIEDGRLERARAYLAEILEINQESVTAQTLLAAIAYLEDNVAEYTAHQRAVMRFSPGNARFYARVAEICGRNYRFGDAVAMARKALAADSQDVRAATILGMNLLRLGREDEGRRHLEQAFEQDPFNFWTMNMLEVLDKLAGFETRRTEHFIVRMHPSDAGILWPYLEPLLEESWQTLTRKYDFQPPGRILIEIFPDHADFAVRTSGLPDIGPLLGVCFGEVITLDSPRAFKPPRSVNWQEVVWHEFAHVITLQMARNRLPRWLSEGISVYEEHHGRPEWGRRQDLALVKAFQAGRILPVKALNEGFSKASSPADLSFAYYQSYLVVEYIVERYGFQSLKDLIYQYRTSQPAEDIFLTVFQAPLDAFENGFSTWLENRIQQINVYVQPTADAAQRVPPEPETAIRQPPPLPQSSTPEALAQALRKRIAAQPRDFEAHFQLGLLLSKNADDNGAIRHLKIARDLLPEYAGDPNPRQALADLYQARGDEAAMLQELETLARYQQHAFEVCFRLAKAYLQRENDLQAIYYLERAVAVDPYQTDVQRLLASTAYKLDDYEKAIRGYQALTALEMTDPVRAHSDLALAYLAGGRTTEAKQAALLALEIAPTFKLAQTILLDALALDSLAAQNVAR